MMMLSHVMKQKQVLGKELVISQSGENRQASTKHKTQKKQRTFENNSNMPRCNALESSNSKFGLGKEPKT